MDVTHPATGLVPVAYKGFQARENPSTIFIASDLHTELRSSDFDAVAGFSDADILVLAGDIGNTNTKSELYRKTIESASKKYKDVVVVAGNHEYYQCQYNHKKVLKKLREIYGAFPNVHFLQQEMKIIQGIEFIGATLWTLISKESANGINDIRSQVFRTQIESVGTFIDDYRYIKNALATLPRVVVTHHLPCFRLINPRFYHCGINDAFYTNVIDEVNLRGVALWACGHTHEGAVVKYMDTKLVVNPLGYPGESKQTVFSAEVYSV